MELIPLIYLKNGKAARLAEANPVWFQDDPLELAQYFAKQGCESLYINDLYVSATGKGENFGAILAIAEKLKLKLWVTGNFKSLSSVETYVQAGVEKIVFGANAYQDPKLLKDSAQKFPQKMAVLIEVKNKKVVIPGLVAPSHKLAEDYAARFEADGASALCYADESLEGIQQFCRRAKAPVLAMADIQVMQDLRKLFEAESAGLIGVV
ncbi:MAG: HisA/HisF-related TIM barrel protein, partial [bacterium]|nr:HisA/HisF-related TIM barrel protein [bacterium]